MNKDFLLFDPFVHSVENNILHHKNIISPFSNYGKVEPLQTKNRIFIDSSYGYSFEENYLKNGAALYGELAHLPDYSGDELNNMGFLRVPFRKIPRVKVNDLMDLRNIISGIKLVDPNLRIHFRGQPREFYLQREEETLSILYNDKSALEPSLLTSSSRKGMRLQDVLPVWNMIVNLFIENFLHHNNISSKHPLAREINNFQSNTNFSLFSLSLAQHYGLPSAGLDISPDLEVALFFAFRKFQKTAIPFEYEYIPNPVDNNYPPVIYIMVPAEAHQFEFSSVRPKILPFSRPDAQNAAFMHTGWGQNKNFAATRIFMALYLNPLGDFGTIRSPADLFPMDDSFARMVDTIRKSTKDQVLLKFLESFYLIK